MHQVAHRATVIWARYQGMCRMALSKPFEASAWFGLCLISSALAAPAESLAPMLDKVLPGVVSVIVTMAPPDQGQDPPHAPFFSQFFEQPQSQDQPEQGFGSGVIIDAAGGLILTNAHVVQDVSAITVRLNDGREAEARVLGTDTATDIAVLKIKLDGLTGIPIGRSAEVRVGDGVVAVGDAFGLDQTVTSGIVSALNRNDLGIEDYEDFIQVDANISSGNSGGPLVDMQGAMVGINTAILQPDGGSTIGFAIPADMAMLVAQELIAHGKMNHGAIGARLQDLTPQLAKALKLTGHSGALVTAILPDSPAQSVGLRPGDLVISANGVAVTSGSLHTIIGMSVAGTRLRLGLIRDGIGLTIDVVLGPRESIALRQSIWPDHEDGILAPNLNGVVLSDAPAYGTKIAGVRVDGVQKGKVGGLMTGDVIVQVNGAPTPNTVTLAKELAETDPPQVLQVYRQNQVIFVVIW